MRRSHRLYVDSISLFMRISREKLSYEPYAKSHERSFIMRIHLWCTHAHSHHRFGEQNITIHQTFFVKFHVELAHLPVCACVYIQLFWVRLSDARLFVMRDASAEAYFVSERRTK